ncbi:MAG: ImmA/IrrE family metallo-endopeptidase [Baekduia sp.]
MPKAKEWSEPLVLKLMSRHGGRPPADIIEAHAESLRAAAEQHSLPVDVELVASVQGVKRRRQPWDFAGRIYADANGQLVMDLNDQDGDERQRFTCAHELMHLAFPGFKKEARYRLDTKEPGQNGTNAEEEYLCDLGASMLLMPRSLVVGQYDIEGGLDEVERLARDARVSLQAAGNRLISIADTPAAFLVFDWRHKPADMPRLRRGAEVSKCLRLRYGSIARLDVYLPRFKGVPDDGPCGRAWHGRWRETGFGPLPGADQLGAFAIEAQAYGSEDRRVVLAVARPAA